MEKLPLDVLFEISRWMDLRSLTALLSTSKFLFGLTKVDMLWKNLVLYHFPECTIKPENWRQLFLKLWSSEAPPYPTASFDSSHLNEFYLNCTLGVEGKLQQVYNLACKYLDKECLAFEKEETVLKIVAMRSYITFGNYNELIPLEKIKLPKNLRDSHEVVIKYWKRLKNQDRIKVKQKFVKLSISSPCWGVNKWYSVQFWSSIHRPSTQGFQMVLVGNNRRGVTMLNEAHGFMNSFSRDEDINVALPAPAPYGLAVTINSKSKKDSSWLLKFAGKKSLDSFLAEFGEYHDDWLLHELNLLEQQSM